MELEEFTKKLTENEDWFPGYNVWAIVTGKDGEYDKEDLDEQT